MHYYLQEAEDGSSSKPLILWLQGGPTASSLLGAFVEVGQLVFTADSYRTGRAVPRLYRNPYAFTAAANMLFLETPVGTGFSRCINASECTSTDTSTAENNHEFLLGFLARFPRFRSNPFFIMGESYAGMFATFLMEEIWRRQLINVSGVALGNACFGTAAGSNCGTIPGYVLNVSWPAWTWWSQTEYYGQRHFISAGLKDSVAAVCSPGDPTAIWTDPLPQGCSAAFTKVEAAVGNSYLNYVTESCPSGGAALSYATATPNGLSQKWCGGQSAFLAWMAMPAVAMALNVNAPMCIPLKLLCAPFTPEPRNMGETYRRMAATPGFKLLVYNGLEDANVPVTGQLGWMRPAEVKAAATTDWLPWYDGVSNETAGNVRVYSLAPTNSSWRYQRSPNQTANAGSFQFVTVRGAGHDVAESQPAAALALLRDFFL